MCSAVVLCGVMRYAELWRVVTWCGVQCCNALRCGVLFCGILYCTALYCTEVLCGVVWCAVLWCGAVCWLRCGVVGLTVVWCGVVLLNASTTEFDPESLTAAYYCRVACILIRQARSPSMPYCDVFLYAYSFVAMLLLAGIFHPSILSR
jgi:hypothetical protein